MKRCLKMLVSLENWQSEWGLKIQKQAQKLAIEGMMQAVDENHLRIMVCGEGEKLDEFMDYLDDFFLKVDARISELEPFIKERDYRGIFRVI